jgi:hypothetical protein
MSGINIGNASNPNFATMFSASSSLVNISNINLNNIGVVANTLTFATTPSLSSLSNVTGAKFTFTVALCNFGKTELESIFANTLSTVTTTQTLSILSNPGTDTAITQTIPGTSSSSSNGISFANTVGITTGMIATAATGLTSNYTVTPSASNITNSLIPFIQPITNGSILSFSSIGTVTGISLYTIYYVINSNGLSFQLSLTSGGSAITLGGTSSAIIFKVPAYVTSVTANSFVNFNVAPNTTATTGTVVSFRNLNTGPALLKNWTITG